jgi:hypothetical protein
VKERKKEMNDNEFRRKGIIVLGGGTKKLSTKLLLVVTALNGLTLTTSSHDSNAQPSVRKHLYVNPNSHDFKRQGKSKKPKKW